MNSLHGGLASSQPAGPKGLPPVLRSSSGEKSTGSADDAAVAIAVLVRAIAAFAYSASPELQIHWQSGREGLASRWPSDFFFGSR